MEQIEKPILVVSKCLGFDSCRFNGQTIPSSFVEELKDHVEYITTCPEVEIGMGTPRDPVKIVELNGKKLLLQPETKRDFTAMMVKFGERFVEDLGEVDGFILKASSPSCGLYNTKIYNSIEKGSSFSMGSGFFGEAIKESYPYLPLEDEGRLNNFSLREHFLTRIFINARYRSLKQKLNMFRLVNFHAEHKYLFMSLNQSRLKKAGNIIANHKKLPVEEVYNLYGQEIALLCQRMPRSSTRINALHHVMGYFSKVISSKEKKYILECIERYRNGKTPFAVPLSLLRSYAIRMENEYLEKQIFFEPFPESLIDLADSGKGRLRK